MEEFIFDLQRFDSDITVGEVTISYDSDINAYKIDSADKLQALATYVNHGGDTSNKTFKLTANITLSDNWTPIGTFKGTFDGGSSEGYTISGLTIEGSNNVGLFSLLDKNGTVKNVNLTGVNISGNQYVGGVVGRNTQTVSDSKHIGLVSYIGDYSSSKYVGGVIGSSETGNANVSNCINIGSVNGWKDGGVVGYYDGSVNDCYYYKPDNNKQTCSQTFK